MNRAQRVGFVFIIVCTSGVFSWMAFVFVVLGLFLVIWPSKDEVSVMEKVKKDAEIYDLKELIFYLTKEDTNENEDKIRDGRIDMLCRKYGISRRSF